MANSRVIYGAALVLGVTGVVLASAARRRVVEPVPSTSVPAAADAPGAAGQIVDVDASEFSFKAPDTIVSGMTTFRLRQAGLVVDRMKAGAHGRALVADKGDDTRGVHMLWVVRLAEGKSAGDLYHAAVAGERLPAWSTQLGGPSFTLPPRTSNITLDLPPGNYALVCYVGSARADRRRAHLLNGMFRALTVVPRSDPDVAAPAPDLVARIMDKGIVELSRPVTAGTRVIRVVNTTSREYEFKFQRMAAGTSAREFLAQPASAGPGIPWGGLGNVPAGATVITTVDVEPGEYVLGTWPPIRHETSQAFVVAAPRL